MEKEVLKPTSSFATFLHAIEDGTIKWDTTTTTANGDLIISQGERNKLRAEGLNAFEEDLRAWASRYDVDVTRSKDGFCLIAEGDDFTFSWEIKCSIKALSYDPFIEANAYEEELALKANKKKKGSTSTTNRDQKRQEWYEKKEV